MRGSAAAVRPFATMRKRLLHDTYALSARRCVRADTIETAQFSGQQ
jgi:hypothetical protein